MAIQQENREHFSSYLKDVLATEKNLFSLRLIRDDLQSKHNECLKNNSKTTEYAHEEPKPVECKLKRVPDKPIKNDSKSRSAFYENIILKAAIVFCVLLFADFIVVLFATGFFGKPISESGAFATLLNIFMVLTLCSVAGFIALRIVEYVQYKEDIKSWLAIKEQIEQHNLEEIKKADELTRQQKQQYYKDIEEENARRRTDKFEANARINVYELQKAKINGIIQAIEKLLAKMYSGTTIPYNFRRIDSVFMLNIYAENSDRASLNEILKAYDKAVSEGSAAERLSDIFEDRAKYAELMPEFSEYIASAEVSALSIAADADKTAAQIASKAVNKSTGAINTGTIATEFHKLFDDSQLGMLLSDISEQNSITAKKYF